MQKAPRSMTVDASLKEFCDGEQRTTGWALEVGAGSIYFVYDERSHSVLFVCWWEAVRWRQNWILQDPEGTLLEQRRGGGCRVETCLTLFRTLPFSSSKAEAVLRTPRKIGDGDGNVRSQSSD